MRITAKHLKYDCRSFRGDLPCKPHKQSGVHCADAGGKPCPHYDPVSGKILIIKLGAIGDVIRTTSLLRLLKKRYPKSEIWWLTLTPDIIPKDVDVVLNFSAKSVVTLMAVKFDFLFNLDKDKEACALFEIVDAKVKKGYTIREGKCVPAGRDSEHKYLTGVFDDISKVNTKSYQQEIFEICGYKFSGEEYMMPEAEPYAWKLPKDKRIVGLNTGCGGRWVSRLWSEDNWTELAKRLKKAGYVPLLLGGEQEDKKNRRIRQRSSALYLGYFPLRQFISEVDQCDLMVTAVTMGMHLAIGLKKKMVLFNNIFNKHEFELYGRGEILEPDFECDCYYAPVCPNDCMQHLSVDTVFDSCKRLLGGTAGRKRKK